MPINAPKYRRGDKVLVKFPKKDNNFNPSGLMNRYIGITRKVTDVIKHGRRYFYLLDGCRSKVDGFQWRFEECDLDLIER